MPNIRRRLRAQIPLLGRTVINSTYDSSELHEAAFAPASARAQFAVRSRMLEPDEAALRHRSPHWNGPIDLIVWHAARFEPPSRFASMNWSVQ
jgi:hypothetical protein